MVFLTDYIFLVLTYFSPYNFPTELSILYYLYHYVNNESPTNTVYQSILLTCVTQNFLGIHMLYVYLYGPIKGKERYGLQTVFSSYNRKLILSQYFLVLKSLNRKISMAKLLACYACTRSGVLSRVQSTQSVRCDVFLLARTHIAPDNFPPHALRTHVCFLPHRTPHPHSHLKITILLFRKNIN